MTLLPPSGWPGRLAPAVNGAAPATRLALVFSLLLSGLVACGADSGAGAGPTQSAVPVETWDAAPSEVSDRVESIGTLVANESVTITAKITDQIHRVHFEDGQMVSAGDVLVELVDSEQVALLHEADANLKEAVLQMERLRKLGSDISTEAQIDVADARVKGSRARLEAIKARVDDRLIRAPFDGQLGFRRVSPGALVTPGTVIAQLDDISVMKLDFNVPETHVAKIQVGNTVEAHSPAWPDKAFTGDVVSIGSRVDPVTRTVTVRAVIENPGHRLRPGMLMRVELIAARRQALVVPEQALIQVAGSSMLYLVNGDSRAERRPVTIGKRVQGGVIVTSGLASGDRVVINGQFLLRPGMQVRTAEAAASGEG